MIQVRFTGGPAHGVHCMEDDRSIMSPHLHATCRSPFSARVEIGEYQLVRCDLMPIDKTTERWVEYEWRAVLT